MPGEVSSVSGEITKSSGIRPRSQLLPDDLLPLIPAERLAKSKNPPHKFLQLTINSIINYYFKDKPTDYVILVGQALADVILGRRPPGWLYCMDLRHTV